MLETITAFYIQAKDAERARRSRKKLNCLSLKKLLGHQVECTYAARNLHKLFEFEPENTSISGIPPYYKTQVVFHSLILYHAEKEKFPLEVKLTTHRSVGVLYAGIDYSQSSLPPELYYGIPGEIIEKSRRLEGWKGVQQLAVALSRQFIEEHIAYSMRFFENESQLEQSLKLL